MSNNSSLIIFNPLSTCILLNSDFLQCRSQGEIHYLVSVHSEEVFIMNVSLNGDPKALGSPAFNSMHAILDPRPYSEPSLKCSIIFPLRCATPITTSRTPQPQSYSIIQSKSGLPPTVTNPLGVLSVNGLSLVAGLHARTIPVGRSAEDIEITSLAKFFLGKRLNKHLNPPSHS